MARWHHIEEADDALFARATLYHARSVEVPYPPEQTWAAITSEGVSSWTKGVRKVTWSPRPFGVGTTREVDMGGSFKLRERFFRWDDGYRKTFTGVEATVGIFRHLVEDYVVEPTERGSRLSWRWAAELNQPWSSFKRTLDRYKFGPTGRSHIDGLAGYMTANNR
jgi:hypothetical protein